MCRRVSTACRPVTDILHRAAAELPLQFAIHPSTEEPSLVIQAVITATVAAAATPRHADSHYRQRSVCVLETLA